jgi:agarase
LNYHQGDVVFEPEHDVDAAAIPVDVNETTVVRLILARDLAPAKKLRTQRHYATKTAVKSQGSPLTFNVDSGETSNLLTARVVNGVHCRGGISEPLAVQINGTQIQINTGDAAEFSEYFPPLAAMVETSVIRTQNLVNITSQPGTTITSVQLVTYRLEN